MKFAEYLAQTLPETTLDHMTALREELFAAGLVKKLEQATLTTEAAKLFALNWYRNSLKESDKVFNKLVQKIQQYICKGDRKIRVVIYEDPQLEVVEQYRDNTDEIFEDPFEDEDWD